MRAHTARASLQRKKEPLVQLQRRTAAIIVGLRRAYPNAQMALTHSTPLELLIATILSAQCTDERVNIVTKELFKRYKTASDYATADVGELEQYVHSTGFYHAKSRNIIGCCKTLIKEHGGKIPDSLEELVTLPGVGRKTANVVLGSVFGKAEGIVVDTHVKRLSERLGLSHQSTPEKIEQDLLMIIQKKDWIVFPHLIILHGRNLCPARKPKCMECPINELCPSAEHFIKLH